ncbi:MAG: MacB family efflux pump subunit [Desulfarculus sp.]|nr:MacB family efflux pump subunit [Desulfarculus sp.]
MSRPLMELRGVGRDYPAGDQTVPVLRDIDLNIDDGEMVAIMGASGSGKSTLMNILGCLDRPTRGTYRVSGRETSELGSDDLARLRREHFGFIFQRYHLLPDLTARGNVEVPAVYAGRDRSERRKRADAILTRLGLDQRLNYRPGQLSGGQQQRVSIARALMNGGQVILADEPTGALDSQSGRELLDLLEDLHVHGHTIVIVTHDPQVAARAQRIIELKDGRVVSDRPNPSAPHRQTSALPPVNNGGQTWRMAWDQFLEALRMALMAMASHRLRTFLTMLGIIIGIASVVSVVALGEGSRQRILSDIASMGTNTIDIFPGSDFGDERSGRVQTLVAADADVLAQQSYVDSVTPRVTSNASLRYRNISATGSINGVGEQYFRVHGYTLDLGRFFDHDSVRQRLLEVVIDQNTRKRLFPNHEDPLHKVIILGKVPCLVVGVTQKKQTPFGNSDSLNVWVPYTTALTRILGRSYVNSITVRINDAVPTAAAEQSIVKLMTRLHNRKDFFVMNTDTIRQTIEQTTATMKLLISMIALISLVVGGIGVMNIMLVSVTERTREIGVRMAVGARQGDIMRQFLVEAVLVCLMGGFLGVMAALGLGMVFARLGGSFKMVFSTASIVAAFACSTLIGVVFGFLPARNAARLDPVEALARE